MTPDVSVYLGGAIRLVQGVVPYRDFVFVQPPGSTLLLAPFGALAGVVGSRDALAVLRCLEPLIAAGDVLLAGRALRRFGAAAAVTGGALVAVFPAELYALRGPMLEPWVVTLGLGAAVLLLDGSAGWAGVLLGVAMSFKLTAVVLVLGGALLCLRRPRYFAGVVIGFTVICLPFVAAAPQSFARDVFVQLGRVHPGGAFYPQYPAALLPALAVAAGWAAARLRLPLRAVGAAALIAIAATAIGLRGLSAPDVAATVDATVPSGACVVTDSPRLTVTSDRFLTRRLGCSKLVDPFGTALVFGAESPAWLAALDSADYFISDRAPGADVRSRFRVEARGRLWICVRQASA
jgi:alpha-1,2-mannosyltransferase